LSKIAFLFPGQGAQTVGMGREACQKLPAARTLFNRANEVLGYDLAELCFDGPEDKLNATVHSQPALFVCALAGLELLKNEAPEVIDQCQATAGLSLGEYTSIVFAGALDFETGLAIVQRRSEAMQSASDAKPSGMVSLLGLDLEQIEQLCAELRSDGEVLQVANHLCPGNIVVSGDQAACDRIAEAAVAAGAMRAIPLAVAGAFHTPIMQSAVEQLLVALGGVAIYVPRIQIISNVDATPHTDPEEIRTLLVQQVVSAVQWEASMRYFLDEGFDLFYEIGPGRVLRGLMKRIHRKSKCEGIEV